VRILVVEDSPETWHAYNRMLRESGHECAWASTALDAVDHLERQDRGIEPHIDLMILDIELGGLMGGTQVAKAAQRYQDEKKYGFQALKVIVISGHSREVAQDKVEHPFAKVTWWLEKPVRESEIMIRVNQIERTSK
jgi:DNA-binding response OmpR family regulator